jgi:tRNA threonylcarbamoyl adenosine modification protein YjeE
MVSVIYAQCSLEDTARIAEELAMRLQKTACVILLRGEMGAGKTTFASAFIQSLSGGKSLRVQSPTYAIANTYATKPKVHHIDLYRLIDNKKLDLESLGILHLIEDNDAFRLIEWPNLIEKELDLKQKIVRVHIEASVDQKDKRTVTIEDSSLAQIKVKNTESNH